MTRVTVFRANFDEATAYGYAWLGRIAEIARGLGHQVTDLAGPTATQSNLFDNLRNFNPELLFLCSHGSATQFSGQNAQIVFTACQDDQLMTGTQAMFLSCLVGQQLLPSMDEKDAVALGGYTAEFTWMIDTEYADRVMEDPYAYPFMRAVVEPAGRLLEGASWQQWYNLTSSLFQAGIDEWWNNPDPNAPQMVAALEHDKNCLAVWGETQIGPTGPVGAAIPILVPAAAIGGILLSLFVL